MSCHRQDSSSVQELQREVQQLNAQAMLLASALEEIKPTANAEASRCAALTAQIDQARTDADQLRLEAQLISTDMTLLMKTGLTSAEIVPGAHLDTLQIGPQLFRDVKIVSIGPDGVLIHHSTGIARLNPRDVLGHDIDAPPSVALPRQVASRVSVMPPDPLTVPPPPPAARPPTTVRSVRMPLYRRPQAVDVIAWWGKGSPYHGLLRDPLGNPLVAIRPDNNKEGCRSPGPWAPRRSSTSTLSSRHRSLSGYKPIGWNYTGSDLDFLYGRRR